MQPTHEQTSDPGKPPVILLVEDHEPFRQVVCGALGLYLKGWQVVEAASVAAALAVLHSRHVDVLVSDMFLPDGTGITLVEGSQALIAAGMKVVIFSNHTHEDMLPVLSRPDVHGYVAKAEGVKALALAIQAAGSSEPKASASPR